MPDYAWKHVCVSMGKHRCTLSHRRNNSLTKMQQLAHRDATTRSQTRNNLLTEAQQLAHRRNNPLTEMQQLAHRDAITIMLQEGGRQGRRGPAFPFLTPPSSVSHLHFPTLVQQSLLFAFHLAFHLGHQSLLFTELLFTRSKRYFSRGANVTFHPEETSLFTRSKRHFSPRINDHQASLRDLVGSISPPRPTHVHTFTPARAVRLLVPRRRALLQLQDVEVAKRVVTLLLACDHPARSWEGACLEAQSTVAA
eukprot:346478-Chlamydomonas_euryale.AAC.2